MRKTLYRLSRYFIPLILLGLFIPSVVAQVTFKGIGLEGQTEVLSEPNGWLSTSDSGFWRRSWQFHGGVAGNSDVQSLGGQYPDDYIRQFVDSISPRIPGENYLVTWAGVPIYLNDNTVFISPNSGDTTVVYANGAYGIYRIHASLNQVLNGASGAGTLSQKYRDLTDTTVGRRGGVLGRAANRVEQIVDPFLQPLSNAGREIVNPNDGARLYLPRSDLSGDPLPNVRYSVWSSKLISDAQTVSFDWPGQDQGDYTNASTDGPHYAMNIWQMKGKFSGVVTLNIKWRGEQLILLVQDPNGAAVESTVLLGPNGVLSGNTSDYQNRWLDFCLRVQPGRLSLGDNAGATLWMKPDTLSAWTQVATYSGDLLSEYEPDFTLPYGITGEYLGLSNMGFYPSTRFSGFALIDRWSPWMIANYNGRGYIKVHHTGQYHVEYTEADDPGSAAVLAAANTLLPTLSYAAPTDPPSVSSATATVTATTSQIRWELGGTVDSVLVRTDSSGTILGNDYLQGPATSFTLTGLEPSSTYRARIRAFNAVGNNGFENVVFTTADPPAPLPPSSPDTLYVGGIDTSSAIVFFSSVSDADTYILRVDSAGQMVQTIGGLSPADTILLVSGLSKATEYTLQVRTSNSNGLGDYGDPIAFTTATGNTYKIIIQKNGTQFLQYNIPQRAADQFRLRLEADGAETFNQSWTDND